MICIRTPSRTRSSHQAIMSMSCGALLTYTVCASTPSLHHPHELHRFPLEPCRVSQHDGLNLRGEVMIGRASDVGLRSHPSPSRGLPFVLR